MMKRRNLSVSVIIFIAIVVMINLLANRFWLRLDFSEDKQYTLSNATTTLLQSLDKPVTVKAYFSDDLPPDFQRVKNQFQELLIEYNARSNGQVVYEFLSPTDNPEIEKQIIGWGVQPLVIEVREKDQKKQMKAFMGAVIEMNDERDPIPFMQAGTAMEYALSSSIRKVAEPSKPRIGFIQGHGEPAILDLSQTMAALSVQYDVVPYFIAGGTVPGPENYTAMVWVLPSDTIPDSHLAFLDEYLALGGNMLIAFNSVQSDFVNFMGYAMPTKLNSWLLEKGIRVDANFVVDSRCGSVTVQQSQGVFSYASNVSFPYLPMVQGVSGHPISQGLEAVMFEFPSEMTFVGDTNLIFEPLVVTSEKSNAYAAPVVLDVQKQWQDSDFSKSNITIAGALSGNFGGNGFSRLVVIADGDFIVNGPRDAARQLQPDNINLFVNSIDWLADDTGLIELRTRGVYSRPLKQLDENTRLMLKYLNFLLPIFLVVLYGIIRARQRKVLRKKRLNQNFS
jgi:gliding-associated putative ABC transporter substrate-binding component GldG